MIPIIFWGTLTAIILKWYDVIAYSWEWIFIPWSVFWACMLFVYFARKFID